MNEEETSFNSDKRPGMGGSRDVTELDTRSSGSKECLGIKKQQR